MNYKYTILYGVTLLAVLVVMSILILNIMDVFLGLDHINILKTGLKY